jgi:hypothetical protein
VVSKKLCELAEKGIHYEDGKEVDESEKALR